MQKEKKQKAELKPRSNIEWYKSDESFDLDSDFDEEVDGEILESLSINKPSSSERVLFISVFLQALLDGTKPETKEEGKASKRNRQSSIKWFTVPSCVTATTYEPICELAGIDPSYVRRFFNQILNKDIDFVRKRINVLLNNIRD